jgi:hypothetical protein
MDNGWNLARSIVSFPFWLHTGGFPSGYTIPDEYYQHTKVAFGSTNGNANVREWFQSCNVRESIISYFVWLNRGNRKGRHRGHDGRKPKHISTGRFGRKKGFSLRLIPSCTSYHHWFLQAQWGNKEEEEVAALKDLAVRIKEAKHEVHLGGRKLEHGQNSSIFFNYTVQFRYWQRT